MVGRTVGCCQNQDLRDLWDGRMGQSKGPTAQLAVVDTGGRLCNNPDHPIEQIRGATTWRQDGWAGQSFR